MNGGGGDRHNLGTVFRFEFVRTVTKRRFWVATLFVPLAMVAVFVLVSASNRSAEASSKALKSAHLSFGYLDASGLVDPAIATRSGGHTVPNRAAGIEQVRSGRLGAFFAYPSDPTTSVVEVFGADKGVFGNDAYSATATAVLQASAAQRVGSPQLAALSAGRVATTTVTYRGGAVAGGLGSVLPGLLFVAVFYVVILFLGNQMLAATLEEKENRVTEMILTTINPTSLILGKILSLFLLGLVQMGIFAAPFAVGYAFFRDQLHIPNVTHLSVNPQTMAVGALILLGGFALFTGTLIALGAAMPTAKDAGPTFGALIALMFIPFYLIPLIVSDPTAPVVQIFTFFPYSAPITALLRNAFGGLPLWQAGILIVELFTLAAVVLRFAVRLFRYGSIEYTRKLSLREALQVPRGHHGAETAEIAPQR